MPVNLEITVADGIQELLARIMARYQRLKPAMGIIGETVQASIQRNFEMGGRPRRWKALSVTTKARRAKKGKWPGLILVVSGILKTITYRAEEDRVILSTGASYAAMQQFGARKGQFGTAIQRVKEHFRMLKSGKKSKVSAHERKTLMPWGDIPPRPFMMIQAEDWTEIKMELMEFLFS